MKFKLAVPKKTQTSAKITQHLLKSSGQKYFVDVTEKPSDGYLSDASSIQILDGTFSNIKPIGSSTPKPSSSNIPIIPNKYEDISEAETESSFEEEGKYLSEESPNKTSDLSKISFEENEEDTNTFMQEACEFVKKTNFILKRKKLKREQLIKKREKAEKKIVRINQEITKLDNLINFASKFADN